MSVGTLDELNVPIRTFHMLCERLSTVQNQNEMLIEALRATEFKRLGTLNNRLLGYPGFTIHHVELDESSEHLKRSGRMSIPDMQTTIAITIRRRKCRYTEWAGLLRKAFGDKRGDEIYAKWEEKESAEGDEVTDDNLWRVGLEEGRLPDIVDEAYDRLLQKEFNHPRLKAHYLGGDGNAHTFFLVSCCQMSPVSEMDYLDAAMAAAEVLGLPWHTIHDMDLIRLNDHDCEEYLDFLAKLTKAPSEWPSLTARELNFIEYQCETFAVLGDYHSDIIRKFMDAAGA